MKAKAMKRTVTLMLLSALVSLSALAGESSGQGDELNVEGHLDKERRLVKDGVLGTVNVLRELDVTTWKNRVTVKGKEADFSRDWWGGPVECTIDGSGMAYLPAKNPEHWTATYTLPGLRTVSSLAIAYQCRAGQAPDTIRLEGSGDGGKTWSEVFKSKPRQESVFVKCFKPAKVNMLRLTQEGGHPHTAEVLAYADPEAPLPHFGGKDSGAFSFLRDLWYAGKITEVRSPDSAVWKAAGYGRPHAPFDSHFRNAHGGAWGNWNPYGVNQPGKRLFLRFDLDQAYPMNYGLISGQEGVENGHDWIIGSKECKAEFYTANGRLDPSTLKGNTIKDLTGQGWILQKAWASDPGVCKGFPFDRPGKYNQMLLVWDATCPGHLWSHLEMFGVETPEAGGSLKNPHK